MSLGQKLAAATGIVMMAAVTSRVLGFLRETALAAQFGASSATDAYLVASTIPNMVFASITSAVLAAFIPVYTGSLLKDRVAAYRSINNVFTVLLLLTAAASLSGILLAPWVVRLLAPGFSGNQYDEAVHLTRWMMPSMLGLAASALASGVLQAQQRFTAPALVGVAANVVLIGSILWLGPVIGIVGVAFGTLAGAAAQVLIQLPSLYKAGYRYQPVIDWRDPTLRQLGALLGPVLLSTAATQFGLIVDRVLASRLAEGSISALNYASRLYILPHSVFVTALVTVLFPTFTRFAAERDLTALGNMVERGLRIILITVLPLAAGMALLREPLVRVLFERGAFDASDTQATAVALLFFSLGLPAVAVTELLQRAYFALQDTRSPMWVGAGTVALNVILNFALVGPLAHGGLALATSLAATAGAVALLAGLRRRLVCLTRLGLTTTLLKSAIATAALAPAVLGAYFLSSLLFPHPGKLYDLLTLASAAVSGALTYAVMLWLLRIPDVLELVSFAVRRLGLRGS